MRSGVGGSETSDAADLVYMAKSSDNAAILLVDDDQRVLDALAAQLMRRSFRVHCATRARPALDLLAREHIDVVVADERMPGIQGSELLDLVSQSHPGILRILLTGHPVDAAAGCAVSDAGVDYVHIKPCPFEALLTSIETGLAERNACVPTHVAHENTR